MEDTDSSKVDPDAWKCCSCGRLKWFEGAQEFREMIGDECEIEDSYWVLGEKTPN